MLQELLTPTSAFACVALALLLPAVFKKRKQLAVSHAATAVSNPNPTDETVKPVRKDIIGIPKFIASDTGPIPELELEEEEQYEYHIKGLPSAEEMAQWVAEQESVLIREADQAVVYIQEALDEISSYPTNREEVEDRVRRVLSSYPIFLETEYYNSINSFIKQAIRRRFTDIDITPEQIAQLWQD